MFKKRGNSRSICMNLFKRQMIIGLMRNRLTNQYLIKFIQKFIYKKKKTQEDYGFDKSEVKKEDLFRFKNFDIPDFPKGEYIKQLAVQGRQLIVVTKSNRIFRWRTEDERGCLEMFLPESGTVGLG